MEQVPFEVMDNYEVADLTDIKAEKNIMPVTKKVKMAVRKAGTQANKAQDIFSLKLELRVVDGIEQTNPETGEVKMAYVNKPFFTGVMDLVFGAKNADTRDKAGKHWWKNGQHLLGFKEFCKALDIPVKGVKINDEFLSSLVGREVLVDVQHEAETANDADGNKVATGDFREKLKNWSKV